MKKLFTSICICIFFSTSFGQSPDTSSPHHHKTSNKELRIRVQPSTNGTAGVVTINAEGASDYKIYSPEGKLQSKGKINNKGQFELAIDSLGVGTYTVTTNKSHYAHFVIL